MFKINKQLIRFSFQGHPRLVTALSKVYSNLLQRKTPIDSQKEVLVTDGAYEALFCAIMVIKEIFICLIFVGIVKPMNSFLS